MFFFLRTPWKYTPCIATASLYKSSFYRRPGYRQPQPPEVRQAAQAPQVQSHISIVKDIPLPFTIFLNWTGPPPLRLWIVTHFKEALFLTWSSPVSCRFQEPPKGITKFGVALRFSQESTHTFHQIRQFAHNPPERLKKTKPLSQSCMSENRESGAFLELPSFKRFAFRTRFCKLSRHASITHFTFAYKI